MFTLEEVPEGTRLTVTETGRAPGLRRRVVVGAGNPCRKTASSLRCLTRAGGVCSRLSLGGSSASLTELAAQLPVSRQAVSKHLAALGDAGLVSSSRSGRETRYRLTPGALGDAVTWIEQVGSQWDERLARLREHLQG